MLADASPKPTWVVVTLMFLLPWQIWSLDDRAYVDTLFGHQADVLAIDARRAERVLTVGADHTCRVWKVPEESQLIYRHGYGQPSGPNSVLREGLLSCGRYPTKVGPGNLPTQVMVTPEVFFRGCEKKYFQVSICEATRRSSA